MKKVAWSNESCFLFHHLDGRVCVHRLPGEQMAPGCTMGRRETLGPAIHVDVTLTRNT